MSCMASGESGRSRPMVMMLLVLLLLVTDGVVAMMVLLGRSRLCYFIVQYRETTIAAPNSASLLQRSAWGFLDDSRAFMLASRCRFEKKEFGGNDQNSNTVRRTCGSGELCARRKRVRRALTPTHMAQRPPKSRVGKEKGTDDALLQRTKLLLAAKRLHCKRHTVLNGQNR